MLNNLIHLIAEVFQEAFIGRASLQEAQNDKVRVMLQDYGCEAEAEPRITIREKVRPVMPDPKKRYKVSPKKLEKLESVSIEHTSWRPFTAERSA